MVVPITTNSELVFETATVIWTAGVQGAVVAGLDANSLVERVERIQSIQSGKGYDDILQ
jgi:NADH dehydrogenase